MALKSRSGLVLDDRPIEEVHDGPRQRRADAVVREEVELRDDLAQVRCRAWRVASSIEA